MQIGELLDDRYRIEALIGSGGMGKVYRATRENLGKLVAIKTLDLDIKASERAELIERFVREAQATAAIRHQNVVELIDFGETSDCLYFVMELLEGYVLAELIGNGRTLEPARMVPLAIQIADGLHAAHVQDTIHRDVKPANVFITPNREGRERVKVLDFGLAKVSDGLKLTRAGVMFGTASYMSPEQAKGASLDARTDVYSLGCVMFEALAGRPPFVGNSWMEIIGQHLQKAPPRITELRPKAKVPVELVDIIECAMAKQPDQRFSGMDALVRALSSLDLPPPPPVERRPPASATTVSKPLRAVESKPKPQQRETSLINLLASLYIMQSYSTDDELSPQEFELTTETLHGWKPSARLAEIEGAVTQAQAEYERADSNEARWARWREVCEELRTQLDQEQRRRVLSAMWRIAGADGQIIEAEREFIAATIERLNSPAAAPTDEPVYEPTRLVAPAFESDGPAPNESQATDEPPYEPTDRIPVAFESEPPHEPTDRMPVVFASEASPTDPSEPPYEPTRFVPAVFEDAAPPLSEPPLLVARYLEAELAPRSAPAIEATEAPPVSEFGFSSEMIRERFGQCRAALAEMLDGTQPLEQLVGGALARWRGNATQLGLERAGGVRRQLTDCFEDGTCEADERLTAALLLLHIAGKEAVTLLLDLVAGNAEDDVGLDVVITALELGLDDPSTALLRGCANAGPEQRGAWLHALERQGIDPVPELGPEILAHALPSDQPDELATGLGLLSIHAGREQHEFTVVPHLFAQQPEVRSAAIVAGLVLGLPQAPILVAQTARQPGMGHIALLHSVTATSRQLDVLIGTSPVSADLAFALALCGRGRAIDAAIRAYSEAAAPRVLAALRYSTGFDGDASQLPSWWAEHRGAFDDDARHLLGQPISARRWRASLAKASTMVWSALRLELLVRSKGTLVLRARGLPDALIAASARIDEDALTWLK